LYQGPTLAGPQRAAGADGLPTFFSFNDPILMAKVQRIKKNLRGRIKTDAMLSLIAAAFRLVPAHPHPYIQYCIFELGALKNGQTAG
jgi:hypothetical protein